MIKQLAETWVVSCACVIAFGGTARAQVCEDDASAACVEDAGSDDGGLAIPESRGVVDAGWADGPPDACSCTSNYSPDDNGRLHICTGSLDPKTCESFTCEQGKRAAVACSVDEVRMCCEMPGRKLYSQLYENCTHPRCELGFRAQCEDFGGELHLGPCDVPEEVVKDEDDGGGICSAVPGQSHGSSLPLWALLGVAWLWSRRRQ